MITVQLWDGKYTYFKTFDTTDEDKAIRMMFTGWKLDTGDKGDFPLEVKVVVPANRDTFAFSR